MYRSGITSKYSKGKLSKLSIARVKYIFYRTFNYIYVNAFFKNYSQFQPPLINISKCFIFCFITEGLTADIFFTHLFNLFAFS